MFEVQTRRRHRRRSSRNRRREVRAAAISVIAACAVVAAFVSAVLVLEPLKEARVAPLTTARETVIAHDLDLEPARDESPRTVYPFSVISGGVYSAEEVAEAVATDPVVNAHYSGVTPAAMHVETVDAPRAAYMSYRIGDQIYWTKRRIALHDGERMLSDGSVTIRARCGNRLSDEPMVPTSDAEPPVEAFEGDPAPPVVAWAEPAVPNSDGPKLSLAAIPAMELPMEPLSVSEPSASVPFVMGPFGGIGAGIPFAEKNHSDDQGEGPTEFSFPPVLFPGGDSDSPNGNNPGDGPPLVIPPTPDFASWTPPGDDHPSDGGPSGDPPLGVPPGLGEPSGDVPPPVVPEPTSLTLFGTGALWMAVKRYRQRKR
jgi:hypothetical protein